jgi:hypothetical protein
MSDEQPIDNKDKSTHYIKWRDTDEVIEQRENMNYWVIHIIHHFCERVDRTANNYLRVCIELYKTPLSYRDDIHVYPHDTDDIAQPGCRTGGWIESKELTEQKRGYLDLINGDHSAYYFLPRKLSTDEKKYLSLCIALWQTPCMYSEHIVQFIVDGHNSWRNTAVTNRCVMVKTENLNCEDDNDDDKKTSPSSATLGSVIFKTDILEKDYDEKNPGSTVAFNPYLKRKRASITGIAHKILKKEDE